PDHQRASLAATSNLPPGHSAAPESISVEPGSVWPLPRALHSGPTATISELNLGFPDLPLGGWDRPPRQAAILPITPSGEQGRAGVLIAALNPYRLLDEDYTRFLELVAREIAGAIANAQAYEDERRRAEELAELDRAKTAFFSNVSHEFRTPLTLMLGPLEEALARPEASLPSDDRAAIETVHRNGLRLLKLVNSLLDFSRIEAGRVQANYQPTDLSALSCELAANFRSLMERAGLRLVLDCPPLPEPVYVDREMWEKIILNLVSNAFKFTFEGEIRIEARADGREAVVRVRDTGTGVPAEELPRMFERFHRIEGARGRTFEGSGIGLALVQELVKLHGGSVSVESELGQGTTFSIRLPFGAEHLPADRIGAHSALDSTATSVDAYVDEAALWLPEAPSSSAAHPAVATAGRVLLADDNTDMREYVRRLLCERYEVEAVADGEAALAAARARPPDLVLSDVMMPRLDGFGLVAALRQDPGLQAIPIVLLSARAGEESRIEGLQHGADDYLVKPFSARELLARVDTHIAMAQARRRLAEEERAARLQAEELAAEQSRLRDELQQQMAAHVQLNTALRATAQARDEALSRAEAERRNLYEVFNQAPAVVAVLRGPDHVFELANPLYMDMVGRHRTIIGKPIREALPEVEGQGFFELLDGVYATGQPYVGNELLGKLDRRGEGDLEDVYFNFVYQPLHDAEGEVNGILVHAVDVTSHVRARELLARQKALLERMAQGAPLPSLLEELTQLIEQHNSGLLCSILLLDRDGQHLHQGAAPSLPPAYSEAIDGLAIGPCAGSCGTAAFRRERVIVQDIAADPLWNGYRELALPHGLRSCWSTPILSRAGQVLGTFAIYYREPRTPTDAELQLIDALTYLAGIAIERDRAEEERKGLQRLRDDFLAAAAHDLKTPLTSIQGMAQLAERQVSRMESPPDRLLASLSALQGASRKAARLIDELLDVARLDTTMRLDLHRSEIDAVRVASSIVEEQQLSSDNHRIELDTQLASLMGRWDGPRLERALSNLVSNAIKYSPEGGDIRVSVRHETVDGQAWALVAVEDHGVGIPAGDVDRIFERFQRASNVMGRIEGTGIGLAYVREIARRHGGDVSVSSEPGRGSTFTLRLPLD
ncbi:MAG TPA: ATP-binding protein, partial [Chloroflexota bacterium]|nr:ATP-binding protein [Chloroflexota bacterium]